MYARITLRAVPAARPTPTVTHIDNRNAWIGSAHSPRNPAGEAGAVDDD
jgi:hypothetical protein